MRIGHFNAREDQLWRWFQIPGTKARLELRLITTTDINAYKNPNNEPGHYRAHVAKAWFRGFDGLEDANGVAIENTEANREVILQDADLWAFVIGKIGRSKEWWEEGKGDSGSAS